MQKINSLNVFTYMLDEQEWYGVDDDARKMLITNILYEAEQEKCRYATIMVKPDMLLSISPIAGSHQVWRHTFEADAAVLLRADLDQAIANAYGAKLDRREIEATFAKYMNDHFGWRLA